MVFLIGILSGVVLAAGSAYAALTAALPTISNRKRVFISGAVGCGYMILSFADFQRLRWLKEFVGWSGYMAPSVLLIAGLLFVAVNSLASGFSFRLQVVLTVALTAASVAGLHRSLLDGLDGALLGMFVGHDTQYAARYSDTQFRRVTTGMTESQVRDLIGDPLEQWLLHGKTDVKAWGWTRSPLSSHYKVRVVAFRDGRVLYKRAEFYLD